MEKEDARKQSREVLHERRKQVIRMHRKGVAVMEIVVQTGLSWTAVNTALRLYKAEGSGALKPGVRGKKPGSGRRLTVSQELAIQQTICDRRPEQLKMDFALWSRPAVRQHIELAHSIKLSIRAVGNYLARWGFTPQKPIKKAYEQRPEAVQAWLDEQYPAIEARAKTEGAEIHWGDETALVNTDVRGRSYAPVGKTPVTFAVGGTRHKLSMIATVTNQGKTRWMIIDEAFNSDKLIEFLEALIKDTDRKVFLILDNLRVHHSKPVKAWAAENAQKIELFYLPSYSPELNPEERLNADLKHVITSKVPVRTKAKLRAAATDHMTMLEQNPERVRRYFRDPKVAYAAS
ncbi:IS630 family transposase [Candidatus Nitrotoga arctica]|uniref:Transposase n=1 Tax=Candidatus Nitrotoga arctica TaxID=453162 RepID=A0ABM8YYG1_9PROT|nr:IS630 family transposase [Candidatus Nitrotoga arctica]CAG9931992.1 transposase [Candidatus Nitrotoga arctica]CAG9932572.1 transposase [Candidatus Nitrotoga arctica]